MNEHEYREFREAFDLDVPPTHIKNNSHFAVLSWNDILPKHGRSMIKEILPTLCQPYEMSNVYTVIKFGHRSFRRPRGITLSSPDPFTDADILTLALHGGHDTYHLRH